MASGIYTFRARAAGDKMAHVMRVRLLVLLVAAAVAGCAAASSSSPPLRQTSAPRTRCLANPSDTELRPLVFLFCIESP
jgi:hypothetical protein